MYVPILPSSYSSLSWLLESPEIELSVTNRTINQGRWIGTQAKFKAANEEKTATYYVHLFLVGGGVVYTCGSRRFFLWQFLEATPPLMVLRFLAFTVEPMRPPRKRCRYHALVEAAVIDSRPSANFLSMRNHFQPSTAEINVPNASKNSFKLQSVDQNSLAHFLGLKHAARLSDSFCFRIHFPSMYT